MEKITIHETTFPRDVVSDLREFEKILRHYGAEKIILYGSLARGDYRKDSDIDLCYEGIPAYDYFRVLAECILRAQRRFNLTDLKTAKGYFRERILNEGKLIYGSR
jgi:predicted nucleotidyltransferase